MDKRLNSVDVLRAFAILNMISSHIYVLLTKQNYGLLGFFISIFAIWAEAMFLTCAGTGFFLFINKQNRLNYLKKEIFKNILKRAVFLFILTLFMLLAFGFIFNMYFTSIIYWSIFQVIAFSMILFFIVPFLKKKIRRIIMISLIFIIYIMYYLIKYNNTEILFILVSGGDFTYFPWASFYVFGMLMGDLMINTEIDKFKKFLTIFFLSGSVFLFLSYFWFVTLEFDMLLIIHISAYSAYFVLFSVLFYLTDLHETKSTLQNSLVRWGNVAFSLYYIHFILIFSCLILFPLIINDIYSSGLLIYQFLILLIIFIVIIEIFLRIWEKYNYIFGIEWFMNKLVKRSLFSEDI